MADLFHRVSIRKYQDRPVEREKIVEILRAAMAAPSAKNQQPWEFYVITKKDTLEKLSKASPYAGMTANAPVAIISAYRKDCDVPCYADIDMSIAMENLWLKTDEIGLGGVWLGIAPIEERMKEVEEIVGFRKIREHSQSFHLDIRRKKERSRTGLMRAGFILMRRSSVKMFR